MSTDRKREVKVGVFVIGLAIAGALTLFMLGGSSDLLRDRYTLHAAYSDVSGLKPGAVVRLAGYDVGEVTSINFSDDLGVKDMYVSMKIMTEYQARIRKDSEARIDTVGVLGDKYVSISMGDPTQTMLNDGEWIEAKDPIDFLEYSKKATGILDSTNNIAHKVDLMLGDDSEAAKASLARSFSHLEQLLQETKGGNGLLHAIVYDDGMTRKVNNTLANLEGMSADLRATTQEVRHGDGIAHELVYGDDGKKLAQELSTLATALSAITNDIKTNDSLVHSLLYDPSKKQMVDDLAVTAAALRETSAAIERGDGTIGMLANDPALYEDLRALVGGAQRNKLLRAYIRKTVEKGEAANAGPWEPVGE